MAFKRSFAVLFVLATSVLASPRDAPEGHHHKSCSEKEFYYITKDCCLPHGGPHNPPPPPPHKTCPPSNWYWNSEKSCCVPKHPLPPNPPPPQCKHGYDWNKATQCCEPGKPTHTHTPHKPSQTPKGGDKGGDKDGDKSGDGGDESPKEGYPKKSQHRKGKRHQTRSSSTLCPRALEACPVAGLSGTEYECMDTAVELRSCGGCASTGKGQDCTAIDGAWNVGCEVGSCAVYTCQVGYKVAADRKSCIKN